ncbi:MAG TPA: hypothetical protein VF611_21715 [Pyrinomonadaceae bacterium]|jgi:hypothetical protein
MKRLVKALALLFLLCAPAPAQTDAPRAAPTPFDSFGDKLYETDWLARLDNMAVEMQNRPDTKAFIVAYGVPNRLPGWPLRRANWAYGVLTKGRGLDPSRVEVVYGGYRDEVSYEHWLMPAGERPPVEPFDFAAALTREKAAYKFDQFSLYDPATDYGYDGRYSEYLDTRGRYEPLALALRHDPAARGLVVVYRSRKNPAGDDRRLAANIKRAVLKAHALAPQRVVAVGGGLREYREVEIWLVPPGAPLPKPTPAPRPARRKRR